MTPMPLSPVQKAWVDTPSRLSAKVNAADYLIIAPDFSEGCGTGPGRLPDGPGISDHDRGYPRISWMSFNHGMYSPHAIRNFLVHALTVWTGLPGMSSLQEKGRMTTRTIWEWAII